MSRCPFNERQLERLEEEFQMFRRLGMARPPRKRSIDMCFILERYGPFIESQIIGRWFGQRAKREDGLPRQQAKTPEQLAILEESFATDPYPDDMRLPSEIAGGVKRAWKAVEAERQEVLQQLAEEEAAAEERQDESDA